MATSAHCALGAGVGGVALAIGGWAAPTIIAAIIGVLAVTIAAAIIPEQMTARKPARRDHPATG
jgi:predicted MFS family arabinose efflux permease